MKLVNLMLTVVGAMLVTTVAVIESAHATVWDFSCDGERVFTWQAVVTDSAGNPIPDGDYQLVYCYYEDSSGMDLIGCCTTIVTVGSSERGLKSGMAATGGQAIAMLNYAHPIWEDTFKLGRAPRLPSPGYPYPWLEITFESEKMIPMTRITGVPDAGTSRRMRGDFFSAKGRAMIVNDTLVTSGIVDLVTNSSTAALALYSSGDDTLPKMTMEANDSGSTVTLLDMTGNARISLTGEGAGTFDDTLWTKTGFKFPDGSFQTTAATGSGGCWGCPANYTYLADINDSVGIGTTSPGEKLEVSGNLRVTGKANIGPGNSNAGRSAFVAGEGNSASGDSSVVSGGANNQASGDKSTVSGGHNNTASNDRSVVGGGYSNTASGFDATVSGGLQNTADGTGATVGGGSQNSAPAQDATVSGGDHNTASGFWSTVGGGTYNEANSKCATVGGGLYDTSKAVYGGVSAGYSNLGGNNISDTAAYVGGGYNNSATAMYSNVGGGRDNSATAPYSSIGGGQNNSATAEHSSVGGGFQNQATDTFATVSGGCANRAFGWRSTVGGGLMNEANEYASTVSGGELNEANGSSSTVSGGRLNSADGSASTVGGGYYNQAAGDYSVIPGGRWDTLTSSADYSMAFGRYVYVDSSYRVVFYDGSNSGYFGINRDDHDGGVLYPIHVGIDGTNGNGAYLTSGGTWTNGSSREFKENFQKLDGQEILNRIDVLPIESWEYKGTSERHIWPCAEDFHEQFDVGVLKEDGTRDTKYLAAGDVAGVALAGVKELAKENRELRERIKKLEVLVETLLAQQKGSAGGTNELALGK
jgi:hypothetical protein